MAITKWIALLRGINVGGNNKLPMKDLVAELKTMKLTNIATYIQSGNVVFDSSRSGRDKLARDIATTVETRFGFRPEVLLLKTKELSELIRSNPFPDAEPTKVSCFVLNAEPDEPDLDSIEELKADSESFSLIGKVGYFHAPEGSGRSKLAARLERLLGVSATARNFRTISKIAELAGVNE